MSISLNAQARPKNQTKGELRQMRTSGQIPACLYGEKKDAVNISVDAKKFLKEMETPGIRSRVFDLGTMGKALVHKAEFAPVGNTPLHIDFLRVDKYATVSVPLKLINARLSPGVKRGGIVNMLMRELRLSVPLEKIPDSIVVDLTGKEMGASINVQSLDIDPSFTVVGVQPTTKIASIAKPAGVSSAEESSSE